MPSAATAATSPPSRRAALRASIRTSLGFVDAHHMGSADRCQAPSIPHPTPELHPAFTPQTNAALSPQRDRAAFRYRNDPRSADRCDHFVSGQPESLTDGNALSPATTASCL